MERENKLIAAVQQDDLKLVKKLISEGANVNGQDEQGWTPLHWSAGSGKIEMLRLLLDSHADIALTGRDNRTPLMVAKAAGRSEAAAVLTQHEKARGDWQDPRQGRPYCKGYYLAALRGYPQWPSENDQAGSTGDDAIVYVHQDFTVSKSVWPGENVIFNAITPEWIRFCESQLKFSIPPDLL